MNTPLNESLLKEISLYLADHDPGLAHVVANYGLPPLWERTPGFASLLHIILEQQVSLASASACFGRLKEFLGEIRPDNFLQINDDDLFKIGFSRQKKEYARGLAQATLNGSFDIGSLDTLTDAELYACMKKLKGVGDWTVDCYALMCLLRPDVLPKGDIALYEAYRRLYRLDGRPSYEYFQANTQHWRPWRSVGSRLLWHFYLCEAKRSSS